MQITSIIENASDITYCNVTFIWEFPNINPEENKSISGYSTSVFFINSDGSIDTNEIVLYEPINNVLSSFIKIDSITNDITPIDYDYTNVEPCIIIIQV